MPGESTDLKGVRRAVRQALATETLDAFRAGYAALLQRPTSALREASVAYLEGVRLRLITPVNPIPEALNSAAMQGYALLPPPEGNREMWMKALADYYSSSFQEGLQITVDMARTRPEYWSFEVLALVVQGAHQYRRFACVLQYGEMFLERFGEPKNPKDHHLPLSMMANVAERLGFYSMALDYATKAFAILHDPVEVLPLIELSLKLERWEEVWHWLKVGFSWKDRFPSLAQHHELLLHYLLNALVTAEELRRMLGKNRTLFVSLATKLRQQMQAGKGKAPAVANLDVLNSLISHPGEDGQQPSVRALA